MAQAKKKPAAKAAQAPEKEAVKTAAEVQRGQTEVSLYSIRSRVQNVYLGILLLYHS